MTDLLELVDINKRVNPVTQDTSKIENPGLKRVIDIALPFLCFYRPTQLIATVGLGGYQIFTIGSGMIQERQTRTRSQQLIAAGKLGLVSAFIALEVTMPDIGTTLAFGYLSCIQSKKAAASFQEKEYSKASRHLLRTANMLAYIASVITGRRELIAASLLLEGGVQTWNAKRHHDKERQPEMFAAAALAFISIGGAYFTLSV